MRFEFYFILLTLLSTLGSAISADCTDVPPEYPNNVPLQLIDFANPSGDVEVAGIWQATPKSPLDIATLANWAHEHDYRLRPVGAGVSWSPAVVKPGSNQDCKTILVSSSSLKNVELIVDEDSGDFRAVKAETGVMMNDLLVFLEQEGLGFGSIAATGFVSVGGYLATSTHGTGILTSTNIPPPGKSFGSLSNMVLELTAVVWNSTASQYQLRTFSRSDPLIVPLLTSLGRIFITEVILRVGRDETFRCRSIVNISMDTLFADADENEVPKDSYSYFLNEAGAGTIIHYPYTNSAWLRVFSRESTQPAGSRKVTQPYNYIFHDRFPKPIGDFYASLLRGNSWLTPYISVISMTATTAGLYTTGMTDVWGSSRNVFLYVSNQSPPVSVTSFPVLTVRGKLQKVLHQIFTMFNNKLNDFKNSGKYPVNAAVEVRVGMVDNSSDAQIQGAQPPAFSVSSPIKSRPDLDTMIWFDVTTFSRTSYVPEFFHDLEADFRARFNGNYSLLRPDWSKKCLYSDEINADQWSDDAGIAQIPDVFEGWREAVNVVTGFDPYEVFKNDIVGNILP